MNAQTGGRPLAVLLLAAGKGTRLGLGDAAPPKVMLECLGVPLIEHVRRALEPLGATRSVVVTGHAAEQVEAWAEKAWPDAITTRQIPQNGTGQAVRIALEAIPDFEGDVLVVYGDVPQLRTDDLQRLLDGRHGEDALAGVLTGEIEDPGWLGRIVRTPSGAFERIVEARDATDNELAIREFNTGIYVFDAAALRTAVVDLPTDNDQGEEYATDAVGRIASVAGVLANDPLALMGVNDFVELADATRALRTRVLEAHMRAGVHIVDPESTFIEVDVEIAPTARVLPFTHIGKGCRIGAGAEVGPFARLRGNTVLEDGAVLGNFVEAKNAHVGKGAKAKHLTYLGDAEVGPKANVGCGVVTANYDGKRKHKTVIGPEASIGSGTILVAPVEVGPGAVTGANAVIRAGHDVPPGTTAVGVPARVLPKQDGEAQEERSSEPA